MRTSLIFHSFDNDKYADKFYDLPLKSYIELLVKLTNNFDPKDILITFDDGYHSIIPAIKAAKDLGFNTKAYVITSKINKIGYLSENNIYDLYSSGTSIGSHTDSHLDLCKIDQNTLVNELKLSKDRLSKIVGREINDLSIPYGSYTNKVLQICLKYYKFVAISRPLIFSSKQLVGRLSIHQGNFQNIIFIKSILNKRINLKFMLITFFVCFLKMFISKNLYRGIKNCLYKFK